MPNKKENPYREIIRKNPSSFSTGFGAIALYDEFDFLIMKLLRRESRNISQLVLDVGISQLNMTKHLKKLLALKLINRDDSHYPDMTISLTEKGINFFDDFSEDIIKYLEERRSPIELESENVNNAVTRIRELLKDEK